MLKNPNQEESDLNHKTKLAKLTIDDLRNWRWRNWLICRERCWNRGRFTSQEVTEKYSIRRSKSYRTARKWQHILTALEAMLLAPLSGTGMALVLVCWIESME